MLEFPERRIAMLKSMGFYKGVNLGGWLSQCDYSKERMDTFITESDFSKIASWGLDHVRIPIDYNVVQNNDGSIKKDGFNRIDTALSWCEKYNLNAVLDLHKTQGFFFHKDQNENGFFDDETLQERFYDLWTEFAKRYGKLNKNVAFELLNEVTEPKFIDAWNRISNECIKRIREFAPDTIVLVGSYHNNSADAVKDLAKPYDDKVIYNFHCYEPFKFTHQGAIWVDTLDINARVSFDESGADTEYFIRQFATALKSAKDNNTTLYCGEYGVIEVASPEDTLKWYKTINSVFEKYEISRSAWSYKQMDFGLSDPRLDSIRDELIKYL